MQNYYYISTNEGKEGPHDLVTMMRRIRAQKINRNTRIFVGDADVAIPASELPDLQVFFAQTSGAKMSDAGAPLFTLKSVLNEGWRFMAEHNIMTVFSGGMTLLCLLIALPLMEGFGQYGGMLMSWIIFVILHYIYSVFCLPLCHGQPLSSNYMNNQLSPVLSTILLASICQALMLAGGLVLLIIPAGAVAVYYIFVPFFIMDRRMSMMEAMVASRILVRKCNGRYFSTIIMLVLAYIGSLILIFPIPITMPIFNAALIKIYDELSAA